MCVVLAGLLNVCCLYRCADDDLESYTHFDRTLLLCLYCVFVTCDSLGCMVDRRSSLSHFRRAFFCECPSLIQLPFGDLLHRNKEPQAEPKNKNTLI